MDEADTQQQRRFTQLGEQVAAMVASGRLSQEEADSLRAAADAGDFSEALREMRLRHAGAWIDAEMGEGRMTEEEAGALRGRLAGRRAAPAGAAGRGHEWGHR